LPFWDFQPLSPPYSLNPFVVDEPADTLQQCYDSPISVAAVLSGKLYNICPERFFITFYSHLIPLYCSGLSDNLTGSALGYLKLFLNMLDTAAASKGA
jgi:hypothetical protein